MAIGAKIFRVFIGLILILTVFSSGVPLFAQSEKTGNEKSIATIRHPAPGEEVAPLDTLLIIEIDSGYSGENFHYIIMLDGKSVDAKWDQSTSAFTYFPERMLHAGEHKIDIFLTLAGIVKNKPIAECSFIVKGISKIPPPENINHSGIFNLDSAPEITVPEIEPENPVISGNSSERYLSGRARTYISWSDLNGLGQSLKQEPENTSVFDINGRNRYDDLMYDFNLYFTSDETKSLQPANRYYFHIENSDLYSISVGDTVPRIGPLFFDGNRLRGIYGRATTGQFSFHFAQGETRQSTESTYNIEGRLIRRGQGARRIYAGRLGILEDGPISLGLNWLRGSETEADVPGIGNPGENSVRSIDFLWKFDSENGSMKGAWSESGYDYNDPEKTDISLARAREFEASYKFDRHEIDAKYQLIEPGFVTFGKTSLPEDRESFSIEDRFSSGSNGITGRIFGEKYSNNVTGLRDNTIQTTRYGGLVRYRFALNAPTLTVNIQNQERTNKLANGASGRIDENTRTIGFGLSHNFKFVEGRHNIRFDWSKNDRDNNANQSNRSKGETITIKLTSSWTRGFRFETQYGITRNRYPEINRRSDLERYTVRASYKPVGGKYDTWVRWEQANSTGSEKYFNSNRDTLEFGMEWDLGEGMTLEASITVRDFNDNNTSDNNFHETMYRIILMRLLN